MKVDGFIVTQGQVDVVLDIYRSAPRDYMRMLLRYMQRDCSGYEDAEDSFHRIDASVCMVLTALHNLDLFVGGYDEYVSRIHALDCLYRDANRILSELRLLSMEDKEDEIDQWRRFAKAFIYD